MVSMVFLVVSIVVLVVSIVLCDGFERQKCLQRL